MSRLLQKHKKKIIAVAAVVFLAVCLFFAIAERFPSLNLPTWDDVYSAGGLNSFATVDGTMEVHVIDVGNADCIFIRQEEHSMLIDAGEKGDADRILNYLSDHGIEKLDYVIATHPHADHIGAMATVIRKIEIGEFFMAFPPESKTPTSSCYLNMLEALDEKSVAVTEAQPGIQRSLGQAAVDILAPITITDDYNNLSVVTRLTFGENRFLLMGDAEKPVEEELMQAGTDLRADFLKMGHHGSRTASTDAFYRAVSPTVAVITCGVGNSYGHPHIETLRRLKEYGTTYYRSDLCGNILAVSDGTTVTVTSDKEGASK